MYNIEYHNFDIQNEDQQLTEISKLIINNIQAGVSNYQIFQQQNFETLVKSITDPVAKIKQFANLIIISMGGATLNPHMLMRFLGKNNNSPKIHFLNNTDPYFFSELFQKIDIKNTAILTISNSGNTLETNALLGCVLEEFEKNNVKDVGKRSFFITNIKSGILKDIAIKIGGYLIPHQENISGRYSGLSNVSLMLAMIAGIDIESYIFGANSTLEDFSKNLAQSKPAISASMLFNSKKNIIVNIGYLQKFDIFLEWYSQIIAESLGKEKKGLTPIKGLGPNDQHSMLQLYLDGPLDKLFSLFYIKDLPRNLLTYKTKDLNELGYLANKNLTDINKANFDATLAALKSQNMPIRSIILENISSCSFGAIVAHHMLEIVIIGHFMKINPFDQPGVELIKKNSTLLISDSY